MATKTNRAEAYYGEKLKIIDGPSQVDIMLRFMDPLNEHDVKFSARHEPSGKEFIISRMTIRTVTIHHGYVWELSGSGYLLLRNVDYSHWPRGCEIKIQDYNLRGPRTGWLTCSL